MDKPTARRRAAYAFAGWIDGRERGYLVESACADLIAAYGKGPLPPVDDAHAALRAGPGEEGLFLMARALAWILAVEG